LDVSLSGRHIGAMKRSDQRRRKRKARPRRGKERAANKRRKPALMIPLPAAWE